MTNDEIFQVMLKVVLWVSLFAIILRDVYLVLKSGVIPHKLKKRTHRKKKQKRQLTMKFYVTIERSKRNADKYGIEYAFGKAEGDERERIAKAITGQNHRGLNSCELDFPVSQRSLEWLRYCGFEVSQTEGITKVSWENAKT